MPGPYSTMPIVGAFYRPPAQALLDAIAVDTPLLLVAEPENQHDPNAIAVWLGSDNIPETAYVRLKENLPSSGFSLEGVLAEPVWHLGYIPRALAAELKAANVLGEHNELAVTFAVSGKGEPRVKFPQPVL